jgi:hypothetical protein
MGSEPSTLRGPRGPLDSTLTPAQLRRLRGELSEGSQHFVRADSFLTDHVHAVASRLSADAAVPVCARGAAGMGNEIVARRRPGGRVDVTMIEYDAGYAAAFEAFTRGYEPLRADPPPTWGGAAIGHRVR